MSDKTKFHNMTKPIKFRRIRLFAKSVGLTYEVGKERIKYFFNYVLYKLNILKKHSYRDNTEQVLPLPFNIPQKEIKSNCIGATVSMKLVLSTHVDEEYFYKENKDGSKKIVYVLRNYSKSYLTSVFHLEDIHLKVADIWYDVSCLPTFKVMSPERLRPFDGDVNAPLKRPEVHTVTYDLTPIKRLTTKDLIGVDIGIEDLSESMLKYYYDKAVSNFEEYLEDVKLSDLMIKED